MKTMQGNSETRWAGMFTASPDYCYAKGKATRAYVKEDRRKLIAKYPRRSYELMGNPSYSTTDGSRASMTFTYSYIYEGSRTAKGSCRESLELVWTGDRWLISRYDEKVLDE